MTRITKSVIWAAVTALSTIAWGAPGIRNSAHDLSNSSGATFKNKEAAHNEICIYCHTPHKAASTQLLWNHAQTLTTSWTWGNDLDNNALTKSTAGTSLPTTLRSASKNCLGCHDGTVAIGDMSNIGGGFAGVMTGFDAIAGQTDAAGKLINSSFLVGGAGNMGGNHPVSVPYAGQTGYNSIDSAVGAAQLDVVGGYYSVSTSGCLSPTGVCTTAPASDGRDGATVNLIPNVPGAKTNVGVECSSCHEPHNKYGFANFARVDNDNASGLCRSCHNK